VNAITIHGIRDLRYEDVAEAELLEAGDAIVRVTHAAICGSDLHVYHGRETGIDAGTVMGHEFIGEVVETGSAVQDVGVGDRVVSPFSTACGACVPCRSGLSARCARGQLFGWVHGGEGLQGAQAEFVRVPLASSTLVRLPDTLPAAAALLLADVLPTGFYCARRAGAHAGGVCAVIGCGPVGLMAILAARHMGGDPIFAIDRVPERLALAGSLGAIPVDASQVDAAEFVRDATDGRGVDAVLEAVGSGDALRLAYALLRPGGVLSVIGVHTDAALAISPAALYDKNVTLRLGRCPARSLIPELIPLAEARATELATLFTHTLPLSEGMRAYEIFDQKLDGCVKVLLEP
jgi:threonine dehydrogenase-like Zn-dependent dehydrogenase